jgi:hypothetical protein
MWAQPAVTDNNKMSIRDDASFTDGSFLVVSINLPVFWGLGLPTGPLTPVAPPQLPLGLGVSALGTSNRPTRFISACYRQYPKSGMGSPG